MAETSEYYRKLHEAIQFVKSKIEENWKPDLAIVLGSGLGKLVEIVNPCKSISYSEIPNMPQTSVAGHSGVMCLGNIGDKKVVVFSGRVHAYEGIRMSEVTFNARLAHALGASIFIATNASGGGISGMSPGDMMIIADHFNAFHRAPLAETSKDERFGPEYADLSCIYSPRLIEWAKKTASELDRSIYEGIYCGTSGPVYETPLEVSAMRRFGAGAFGMSTVPETVTSCSLGMEVFAVALCTNAAAGLSILELSHEEVKTEAENAGPRFVEFMHKFIETLPLEEKRETYKLPEESKPVPPPHKMSRLINKEECEHDANIIREKFGDLNTPIAILVPSYFEDHLLNDQSLSSPTIISFSDLKFCPPPQYFDGGKIVIGNRGSVTVIHVVEGHICGLTNELATYFATIFRELGVSTLICSLFSRSLVNEHRVGDIVGLTDCFSWSTIHPSITLEQYNTQTPLLTPLEIYEKMGVSTGRYSGMLGPSYPTKTEVSAAIAIHSEFCGITSLAPVYAMRSAGIDVAAFSVVVHSGHAFELDPNFKSTFESFFTSLYAFIPNHPSLFEREVCTLVRKYAEVESEYQISTDLPYPMKQGDTAEIAETVEIIKAAFAKQYPDNPSVEFALIIYEPFRSFLSHVSATKIETKLGEFYAANFCTRNVVVAVQKYFMNGGYSQHELTFTPRVIGELKVNSAIFSEFCGVDDSMRVGDVIIVKDHYNFSGRSPLFGHNIPEWGTRFFDMSKIYKFNILTLSHQAYVGMSIGPIFHSKMEAKYYSYALCKAVTTGVVPEVHVLRHAMSASEYRTPIVCFGVITCSMQNYKYKRPKKIPSELLEGLEKSLCFILSK